MSLFQPRWRPLIVLIAVMLWALSIFFLEDVIRYYSPKQSKKPAVHVKVEAVNIEPILTGWIYNKSSRISRNTCKEIAVESVKTGKPLLILAVIQAESEFVPSSVSNKGAMGLAQIMDVHVKDLIKAGIIHEKRDLFNIPQSIHACNFILDGFLKRTGGNVSKALELYLGARDGVYLHKTLSNLADLYVLTLEVK